MITNKHNPNYAVLLTIFIVLVLASFGGWYALQKNNIAQSSDTSKAGQQKSNLSRIILRTPTGEPLANTRVNIHSDNGVRCIQAPCPSNDKSWEGVTDDDGVISVPGDIIQKVTTITANGYQTATIPYDDTKMTYEVKLER